MTLLRSLLASLALFFCVAPAAGQHETPVNLNFANADVVTVINAIGQITGRNFIIDPRVSGTLSIITHTPIAADAAYRTFLAALRVHGYTAIEGDGFTRILPAADARTHGVAVSAAGAADSQLVTRIFRLEHALVGSAIQTISPLLSQKDAVTAIPESNLLVVTDFADSLRTVETVLARLDAPTTGLGVIPLNYAVASDLAVTLTRILVDGQPGGDSRGLRVVAEQRTNSLVVSAPSVGKMTEIRALVEQLDRPGAGGNVHVVYLHNADAARLAETLNAILASSDAGATGGAAAELPRGAGAALIKADTHSNALIIVAAEAVYRNLRGVIDRLDRRRAQVYIEALIAEVSSERAAEIGIQWQTTNLGRSGTALLGGTNFGQGGRNIIGAAQNIGSVERGLNLLVGRGTVSIPVGGEMIEVFNLGLLARFLEADTRSNILSTPTIVTLDNEEASIVVGRNLPFITGRFTGTGNGPENPFQTIERQDVGLTLRVRPQISEGGTVRLEIFQEVSSVDDRTLGQPAGPVTNKRAITTNVLVDDGAILALGGLVEDRFTAGEERVPLLGDLPVAGNLFRYRSRERVKTNLIVFLRPVILRDEPSSAALSGSRYDYLLGLQQASADGVLALRGEGGPPSLPFRDDLDLAQQPWPPAPVREARIVPVGILR